MRKVLVIGKKMIKYNMNLHETYLRTENSKIPARGEIHMKRYRYKDYFCASAKAWVKAGIKRLSS